MTMAAETMMSNISRSTSHHTLSSPHCSPPSVFPLTPGVVVPVGEVGVVGCCGVVGTEGCGVVGVFTIGVLGVVGVAPTGAEVPGRFT